MFQEGDKIVCIDNINWDRTKDMHNPFAYNPLNLYEIYEVKRVVYGEHDYNNQVVIELHNVILLSFAFKRFVLLTEFRKMKIKKICSKLEIK